MPTALRNARMTLEPGQLESILDLETCSNQFDPTKVPFWVP